jgi:hypothetical protein
VKSLKFFPIFAILVVLILPSTYAFGEKADYDSKDNSYTLKTLLGSVILETKLINNTCSSPVECEAQIWMKAGTDDLTLDKFIWNFYGTNLKSKNTNYQLEVLTTIKGKQQVKDKCETKEIDNPNYDEKNKDMPKKIKQETCTHKDEDYYYSEFQSVTKDYVLKSGQAVLIKLHVHRKANDIIEWVPEFKYSDTNTEKLSKWAWWNTTWYKRIQVNVSSDNTLTAFPRYAELPITPAQGTYQTIRLANETSELDYCADWYNDTAIAVWVKENYAAGVNSIYAYYDNSTTVANGEDCANTFSEFKLVYLFGSEIHNLTNVVNEAQNKLKQNGTVNVQGTATPFGKGADFVGGAWPAHNLLMNTTLAGLTSGNINNTWGMYLKQAESATGLRNVNYLGAIASAQVVGLILDDGIKVASYHQGATYWWTYSTNIDRYVNATLLSLTFTGSTNETVWENGIPLFAREPAFDNNMTPSQILIGGEPNTGWGCGGWNGTADFYFYAEKVFSDAYLVGLANNTQPEMIVFGEEEDEIPAFNVTLTSPADNLVTHDTILRFNCSAADATNDLTNITYHVWNATGQPTLYAATEVTGSYNTSSLLGGIFESGVWLWNCMASNNISNSTFALANRTFRVDQIPEITTAWINASDMGLNRTTADLTLIYSVSDDLNDSITTIETKWYNSSVEAPILVNVTTVTSIFTTKGDVFLAEFRVYDGYWWSNWFNSSSLTILNTPPVLSKINLTSDAMTMNTTYANLSVVYDYSDADGDTVTAFSIDWYKNSVLQSSLADLTTIDSGNTTTGQIWKVGVKLYNSSNVNYLCYQESANISTTCGGLNNGNYNIYTPFSYLNGFIYINYTIPIGTISGKWAVYTGKPTGSFINNSNFTLPINCISGSILSFKITSSSQARTLNGDCWNGVNWQNIFNITNYYSGAGGGEHSENYIRYAYDGDLDTATLWHTGYLQWVSPQVGMDWSLFLREEAVIWDINDTSYSNQLNSTNLTILESHAVDEILWTTPVYEWQGNEFSISLTSTNDIPTIACPFNPTVYLNYNNTQFFASNYWNDDSGGYCSRMNYSATINAPQNTSASNYSFDFNITFPAVTYGGYTQSASNESSDTNYQEVLQFFITPTDCDAANESLILNVSCYYEETRTADNCSLEYSIDYWPKNSAKSFGYSTMNAGKSFGYSTMNGSSAAARNHYLCLTPYGINISADALFESKNVNYSVKKTYWLRNVSFTTGTPIAVDLYLLNSSLSTLFNIFVLDELYDPAPNYYVLTQRYYTDINSYITTESSKTDITGETLAHLYISNPFYKFLIYDYTTLVKTVNPTQPTCAALPCEVTWIIQPEVADLYAIIDGVLYNTTYNTATKNFRFDWTDTSGLTSTAQLIVNKVGTYTDTTICDSSTSSSSGTILCDVSGNGTGTYIAKTYLTKSGETHILPTTSAQVATDHSIYSKDGLFWATILIITVAIVGLALGSIIMGFILPLAVLAILSMPAINIISIPFNVIIGLIIFVLFVIVKIKS